jgi:hypothetical protein
LYFVTVTLWYWTGAGAGSGAATTGAHGAPHGAAEQGGAIWPHDALRRPNASLVPGSSALPAKATITAVVRTECFIVDTP